MNRLNFCWRALLVGAFASTLSIAAVGETIEMAAPPHIMASARHRLAVALRRKAFGDRLVRRKVVAGVEPKDAVATTVSTPKPVAHDEKQARVKKHITARWMALAHRISRRSRDNLRVARMPHRRRPPLPAAAAVADEMHVALADLGPSAKEGQRIWVRVFGPSGVDREASAVFLGDLPTDALTASPLNCWGQPVLFVRRSAEQWARSMVCDNRPADTNEWAAQVYYGGLVATR